LRVPSHFRFFLIFAYAILLLTAWSVTAQSNVSVAAFGAKGDAIMRNDGAMTAGSPILTSVSGSFSTGDVGKYVQVIGAGPGGTSHADAIMSAGSAVLTSPSGTFSPSDVGRGVIVLGAGVSHGNLITSVAAYTSTTSVALVAIASTSVSGAAYFYGAMTLEGTIASVESPKSATLSAVAAATITGATFVYGTDDHAAFQSAVDSVGQSGGGIVSVPQPAACPSLAICGYVIKATDQMTAPISSAVKIRQGNVSLVGDSVQTNLFCRGAWSTYADSAQFPKHTAAMRGGCLVIGDNAEPLSNITIAKLHLYGMTNGNTYSVSFDPTQPPLLTTGDGWDITHKAIHFKDGESFSNITIDSVIIQDFKGENIFSGGSTLKGIVIKNSTLTNFNGDGISMLAADLQVLNNTITNGSNAGIENSTVSSAGAALIRQLYESNSISSMPREALNIVGVDKGLVSGSIQIINNSFNTIGQDRGSGARTAIFVNAQTPENVAPRNVTITGNTCVDCFSFAILQTSGTTLVSDNTFAVDTFDCSNFLSFTFPQSNVTISGNRGYRTPVAVANSRNLGSVYVLDPGYKTGNFKWSNLAIQNNTWKFPGVPHYTFVTSSGPGFSILTGRNVIWHGDTCQDCTYPDQDHGLVTLSVSTTIKPYGPIVYVSGNTGPVTATVDASKEEDGSQVQIVNAGANAVTFVSDSNLSLANPIVLQGGALNSLILIYSDVQHKFVLDSQPPLQ